MKEVSVASVGQILEATAKLERENDQRMWFRGHYEVSWRLVPGAFRREVHRDKKNYERLLAQNFLLRARARHPHSPDRADFGAWIFLMQHYRLPTRMLDWSESPLVGAYFAVWNDANPQKVEDEDAIVFALAPNTLNELQLEHGMLGLIEDAEVRHLVPPWLHPDMDDDASGEGQGPRAAAILPEQVDPRIVAQQGAFTIHAPNVALEDLDRCGTFLTRLVIPGKAREGIREDLLRIGIRPMNLFPDLDHLSADLKNFEQVI